MEIDCWLIRSLQTFALLERLIHIQTVLHFIPMSILVLIPVLSKPRFQNDFLPTDFDSIAIHRFTKLQGTAGKTHTTATANEFCFHGDASHR